MKSKFFRLNGTDLLNGLLLAVITVVLGGIQTILTAEGNSWGTGAEWMALLKASALAAVSYLGMNLITNSEGEVGATEKK